MIVSGYEFESKAFHARTGEIPGFRGNYAWLSVGCSDFRAVPECPPICYLSHCHDVTGGIPGERFQQMPVVFLILFKPIIVVRVDEQNAGSHQAPNPGCYLKRVLRCFCWCQILEMNQLVIL